MIRRLRAPFRHPRRDERGFFLVFLAVLLVTILALAGFAVDFWHWNHEGSRMQKAADAAALGGAVFMPENPGGVAFTTAKGIASRNGYADGSDDTVINVEPGQRPNQLKVRITKTVDNYFGTLVGANRTTITKHAVAEFERSINMGSPINQFGNDPEQFADNHGTPRFPDLWANVFGPASRKPRGDAILSKSCAGNPDNCTGGTNKDFDANGYFYGIEVAAGAVGPMKVQIFDPEFAHVGDNCGDSTSNGGANPHLGGTGGASTLAPNFNPQFAVSDPSTRYAPDASSPFCSGDQYYGDDGTVPPWTTFVVRGPDETPDDATNNPIISDCSKDFPGYNGNIATAVTATTPQTGATDLFVKYFRQWYTLCTINVPEPGTYYVQAQTATKVDGTATPNGGGANRFAMRVSINGDPNTAAARFFGKDKIGVYANAPGANSTFYLARVLPGAKGRNLIITFFDTGDAASAGTITILPPPDSNLTSFASCTYTPPPGNSTGPPWGTFTSTSSGCAVSGVSSAAGWDGQWVQYKIPLPDDYTCSYDDPSGCWTRVRFSFPSQTSVQDTTTWTAHIEGDPVRLIE